MKKNRSNKKLDGMPIKISVRFETELLQREVDKLDLENMGLSQLKEIIQEHMIVTLANVGPKGICFPEREEDEEIINKSIKDIDKAIDYLGWLKKEYSKKR